MQTLIKIASAAEAVEEPELTRGQRARNFIGRHKGKILAGTGLVGAAGGGLYALRRGKRVKDAGPKLLPGRPEPKLLGHDPEPKPKLPSFAARFGAPAESSVKPDLDKLRQKTENAGVMDRLRTKYEDMRNEKPKDSLADLKSKLQQGLMIREANKALGGG